MEDESSEATIPKPFVIREEAEETQVRQVATATPKRSLEATSEPSVEGEDIPSPQLAVDPSTLLLEMPEDRLHQSWLWTLLLQPLQYYI